MNTETNKALVERLDAILNTGDLGQLDELCSPDMVNHSLAPSRPPGLADLPALSRPSRVPWRQSCLALGAPAAVPGSWLSVCSQVSDSMVPLNQCPAGHLIMVLSSGPSVERMVNRHRSSAGSPQRRAPPWSR